MSEMTVIEHINDTALWLKVYLTASSCVTSIFFGFAFVGDRSELELRAKIFALLEMKESQEGRSRLWRSDADVTYMEDVTRDLRRFIAVMFALGVTSMASIAIGSIWLNPGNETHILGSGWQYCGAAVGLLVSCTLWVIFGPSTEEIAARARRFGRKSSAGGPLD